MTKEKIFILYDGRAKSGDTDDSDVMDMATSEKQARKEGLGTWKGYDAIWYEYEVKGRSKKLVNGIPRFDLPPAN